MYAYYMLAAMGPKVQKYLWWKKYLTVMQMIQFVLVMVHSFQLFFKNDCNYPIGFAYFIGAHAVMFYFLFSNFYKRAYVKRDGKVSSLHLIDVGRFYQKMKICIKQSSVKLLGLNVKVSGPGLGNHQSIIIGVGIELKMDRAEQNRTQQNIIPMGAIYADFVDHNWQILIW